MKHLLLPPTPATPYTHGALFREATKLLPCPRSLLVVPLQLVTLNEREALIGCSIAFLKSRHTEQHTKTHAHRRFFDRFSEVLHRFCDQLTDKFIRVPVTAAFANSRRYCTHDRSGPPSRK